MGSVIIFLISASLALINGINCQVARYNVTWQDLKPISQGGRILEEDDCIIAIPHLYGECVANNEIGLQLRLTGDHSRWKGIGYYPNNPAEEEPRMLVEDPADGGEDMMGIVPARSINENFVVLWKAERTGIIRPGDDLYPAYMITDGAEHMEGGVLYDFNWKEDADNC